MKTSVMLSAVLWLLSGVAGIEGANIRVAPRDRFTLDRSAWWVNGETNLVTLKVSKLTFNHSGNTGTIKLMLWATTQPYQTGIKGFAIAEKKLGQLNWNQCYRDIDTSVALIRPPAGVYYLTLMVLEFKNGVFERRAYINGTNTFTF